MGSIYGEYKSKNGNMKIIDEVFWDKLKFIDYIINNHIFYDNAYIISTNLTFDFFALFEDTDILPLFNLIIRNSSLIVAKLKHKTRNNTLTFIDSLSFSKISVKKMGEHIGMPKAIQPICFKKLPKDDTEKEEMERYNRQDTRITYEFCKKLQEGFNLLGASMKTTVASTSMDLFKRRFLKNTLVQDKEHLKLLYEAYYGARVEVLKKGYIKNMFYYDFNSLYPSVMLNEFPFPNSEKYTKRCDMNTIQKYEGIVKVTVNIKNIKLPYLPFRKYFKLNPNNLENKNDFQNKENSQYKLIFPIGTFTGYYTFFEIREAIKLGYRILDIGEAVYYTEKFKPFYNYVTTLYNKRLKHKEQKSFLAEVDKLNLNTLYGKFAQKIDNKEEIYHIDFLEEKQFNEFMNNSELYKTIFKGDYIYVTRKTEPYIASFIIPIFSIYVTAYGRDKLYNKIIELGVENIFYYDTDSIITTEEIEFSDKIGELKLEYVILEGFLVAPKFYYLKTIGGEVIKIKGIPHIEGEKEFLEILRQKKYIYEKFVKFKEANARNLKFNEIITVEKNLSLIDNKRFWKNEFNFDSYIDSEPLLIYEP